MEARKVELLPQKPIVRLRPRVSEESRIILEKLPKPDIISLMEDLMADNNNQVNNNSMPAVEGLEREELMQAMEAVPTEVIKEILRSQGILQ